MSGGDEVSKGWLAKVGSIVVTTGYKVMEKDWFNEMAPNSPNVITALQLERLISATGPTGSSL